LTGIRQLTSLHVVIPKGYYLPILSPNRTGQQPPFVHPFLAAGDNGKKEMVNHSRKVTGENLGDILAYLKTHGVSETAHEFNMNRVTLIQSLRPLIMGLKMLLILIGNITELEAEQMAHKLVYGEEQQTISLTYNDLLSQNNGREMRR